MILMFDTLTLQNFMSYGNNVTTIPLNRPGTTLIVGEDLDHPSSGQSNGVGKAQPLHCKIKVPGGWKTMGDVTRGDVVCTPDGATSLVLDTFHQGLRPVYKITFADGRSTEADENHLWEVFSHRWSTRTKSLKTNRNTKILTTSELIHWVDTANKSKYNKYSIFVPLVQPAQITDTQLPIHPYLLGCLLGDGGFTTRDVTFTNSDAECVAHVSELLQPFSQELVSYTNDINYKIRSTGSRVNAIADALTSLNLMGCDSSLKFIPPIYLEGSTQQKLDLLRGLLDTDGFVSKAGSVSFSSTSKQLAEDVAYLVRSLGGKSTMSIRHPHYYYKGTKREGKVCYEVRIAYPNPTQLFNISRKKNRFNKESTQYSNAGLRIQSIEYIGETETKCILIDHPKHLYITDDFIVTHNTTVMNALTYALYDKPISDDISKDDLVNNINKKNMEVTLGFTGADGVNYYIKRSRKTKAGNAGNNVYLYINGIDKTPDSIAATNAMIESIIGIPYEVFVRIVVFSASHQPFLNLSTKDQTAIIEELFGLTSISRKAELLKAVIKDTENSLKVQQARLESAKGEQERHAGQVDAAKKRIAAWDVQHTQSIETLKQQIEDLSGIDIKVQQELLDQYTTISEEIKAAQVQVDTVNTTLTNHNRLIKTKEKDRQTIVSLMTTTHKNIKKQEEEQNHLQNATCPYCLQHFEDTQSKIELCKQTIIKHEAELNALDVELEQLEHELADDIAMRGKFEFSAMAQTQHLNNLKEQLKHINRQIVVASSKELQQMENEKVNLQKKIDDLTTAENPHQEALDELIAATIPDPDYTEVNALSKIIDHQKFLLKLLTKKDSFVRKTLLNKNIPFLNSKLQEYLNELGLPHKVEFTKEMSASISQFGRTLGFGNLSQGQRARVNFALSLAFKDVLQSIHTKVNVFMLDEILDHGLDSVGVQAAARVVKRKARDEHLAMFVISHREEVSNTFDRKMVVQLRDGFSHIKGHDGSK